MELLVVMGLMGFLGTVSIGGYRALQRGMEERGVMENVNSLIRSAYQRAQIDRQPVAVYFWNETLRSRTDSDNEIVAGRAVAVRRYGRITRKQGTFLIDEFADLDQVYQTDEDETGGSAEKSLMYLYPMHSLDDIQDSSNLKRSSVRTRVYDKGDMPNFLSGNKTDWTADERVPAWAFYVQNANNVDWKPGMAYGFEFIHLELPHNYIFGSSYSRNVDSPVKGAGTLVFDVGVNKGGGLNKGGVLGRKSISVMSLRQKGADLEAVKVADSDNPEKDK